MTDFCAQNKAISANSDVYIGFVGWGAGSFDTSYILSLTPSGEPGKYTDNELMNQCILDQFTLDSKYAPTPTSVSTTAAETTTSTPTESASGTSTNSNGSPSSTTPSPDKQSSPSPSGKGDPVNNPSTDTSNSSKDGKSAAPSGAKALTGSLLLTFTAFCYMLVAF
jgi:endoglucanase